MVWSNSRRLGCAGAEFDKYTYYVCRYSPAGNVIGKYDDYVKPLKIGTSIPTNVKYFIPKDSYSICKDTHPLYCEQITGPMCTSASFGSFNQAACPKKCKQC